MQGALGEKLGEGVWADIHAWAPGQVVKLFKAGVRWGTGKHEARMTRAVFAAGGPAPQVLDEVMLDDRYGIVLPRLDGPTLLERLAAGEVSPTEAGEVLAGLYTSVHDTPPPAEVLQLNDWMGANLPRLNSLLPAHIVDGVPALLARLPPGDGLCHCDLHAGNVIMTADGPRIIDWTGAVRAPTAFDLGICRVTHLELVPDANPAPERPRALYAAALGKYARLTGTAVAALTAEIERFMPIVRVVALLGGAASPDCRTRLIQSVQAALDEAD